MGWYRFVAAARVARAAGGALSRIRAKAFMLASALDLVPHETCAKLRALSPRTLVAQGTPPVIE
jgi:hypothetical protein